MSFNKEPKQATTEMATSTQQTKELLCTCVINQFYFFAVLRTQQRDMSIFCVFWRTQTTAANFTYFHLELIDGVTNLA